MQPKQNNRTALAAELQSWAVPLTCVLFASLVCNILALVYPFLEFSAAFKGRQFYSIPLTISLMWDFGLYVAAILIVAFSLIFPFVKLALLLMTLWRPMTQAGRHRLLGALRHLGRWSLLDVYIVLTILVLADDQVFIGAVPRVGVTLFLVAIGASMATCELLHHFDESDSPTGHDPMPTRKMALSWKSGRTFWLMILLLPLSMISLFAALGIPYFHISQFLLKHKAYSVINSITALSESGLMAFAMTMLAFLVAFPVAKLIFMAIYVFVPMTRALRKRVGRWSSILGAWSMLDVFALALVLFLTEGSRLIKFEIRFGLYMIVISVGIYYLTLLVNSQTASPALSEVSDGE